MKRNNVIYIVVGIVLVLLIIFLNRDRKELNSDNNTLYEEFYPSGALKVTGQLNHQNQGKLKYYAEDGKLQSIAEVKDGKVHGWRINYNKKGAIESKAQYKMNKQDGESIEYNSRGGTSAQFNWLDGNPFGNSIYYNDNGKIKAYNARGFYGEVYLTILYDTLANIRSDDGEVISSRPFVITKSSTYAKSPSSSIFTGDIEAIVFSIAEPPGFEAIVSSEIYRREGTEGKIIERVKAVPIKRNMHSIKIQNYPSGNYEIVVRAEIKSNTLKKSSIVKYSFSIN